MKIIKIAKKLSFHISLMLLITISVFLVIKDDVFEFVDRYESMQKRELLIVEREVRQEVSLKQRDFFHQLLIGYLRDHSHVDIGRQKQCDSEYMAEYRKAKAALRAVEGAAIASGEYEQYERFFENQKVAFMQVSC